MRAQLTIESGPGDPRVCILPLDRPCTLGRHPESSIVLHDERASRHHAEVYHEEGHWFIRDKGTRNGTRVDGVPIAQATALAHDQVIGIGHTALRFSVQPTSSRPSVVTKVDEPIGAVPAPQGEEEEDTVLGADELSVLYEFMTAAVKETDARALVARALETLRSHLNASIAGFLSLDPDEPVPKVVQPSLARVDLHLSRHLTQAVERAGRAVWLGGQPLADSESIQGFADAVCVPLRPGETPLGAIHVYRAPGLFARHEVRFCEVLAGHLASMLDVLRVRSKLEAENVRLRTRSSAAEELIGGSPAMQALRERIAKLAPRPFPVLVLGESGAGKELVALALHRQSPRREAALVCVNCAALAPSLLESELFGHRRGAFSGADRDHAGYFQQADEGTLFLDEVGELSADCQAKLLRVIEGKGFRPVGAESEIQVNVRIVAATNRDLEADASRFRRDLFFRLQGVQIRVPPLRDRLEDIPELADHFLKRLSADWGRTVKLTAGAVQRLQAYSWPGNVRQFRTLLEGAVALADKQTLDSPDLILPSDPSPERPHTLNLEEVEALAIRQVLAQTRGNVTQAAQLLGIGRDTLANKMKKYGISKD